MNTNEYLKKFGNVPNLALNEVIVNNGQQINERTADNVSKVRGFEIGVFIGVTANSILLFITLLLFCCSLSKNNPSISLGNSTLSLLLMLISSVLFALIHFRGIYLLDYCEQILDVTEYNNIPAQGKGLATSLSCLSNEATTSTATLGYQLYNEYQKGLILANDRL